MTLARAGGIALFCTSLASSALGAADLSSYRGLKFGMTVAAATKQSGPTSAAKLIYQRPASIQEMNWRPSAFVSADPVQSAVLQFVDDSLARIVITYERKKIEGMAAQDMIDAISATYGAATTPGGEIAYRSLYGESAPVLARWEDAEYSCDLVPTGDQSGYALILYSKSSDARAQKAITEALRLEKEEGPQRERDLQAKYDEAERLRLEKVRSVNKPNFRP